MKFIKDNKHFIICFVIVFLFSLVFPYTGDDLDWSFKSLSLGGFMDVVSDERLNGRYLGNLFTILITRNIFVRGIIIAFVLTSIVYIISKRTRTDVSCAWLLLLLMPIKVFAQSIVWASGFVNYTISTFLLLLCLIRIQKIFSSKADGVSILNFLLFLATSLFMENITIFLIIFTFILNIVYYIRNKRVSTQLVICFLGSLAGTLLMFSHPVYHNIVAKEDKYRTLNFGLKEMLDRCFQNYNLIMYEYIAFKNILIVLSLTGLLFYYFRKHNYRQDEKTYIRAIFYYFFFYLGYIILSEVISHYIDIDYTLKILNAILTLFYLVFLVIQLVLLFPKKDFIKVFMPIVVIIGLVGPLSIVTPIGPRNFFPIYVLEVAVVLSVMSLSKFEVNAKVVQTILALSLVCYFVIYSFISYVNLERNEYVRHISRDTNDIDIVVPTIPLSDFVHFADYKKNDYWRSLYIKYISVREDLVFEYIDYREWKSKYKK